MMTSDDKVGGWVKKGQNHDDVKLEWSHTFPSSTNWVSGLPRATSSRILMVSKYLNNLDQFFWISSNVCRPTWRTSRICFVVARVASNWASFWMFSWIFLPTSMSLSKATSCLCLALSNWPRAVSNFIVADLTSLDPVESSLLYNVEEHFEDKNLKTSLLMAPSILTNKLLDKKSKKIYQFFSKFS